MAPADDRNRGGKLGHADRADVWGAEGNSLAPTFWILVNLEVLVL